LDRNVKTYYINKKNIIIIVRKLTDRFVYFINDIHNIFYFYVKYSRSSLSKCGLVITNDTGLVNRTTVSRAKFRSPEDQTIRATHRAVAKLLFIFINAALLHYIINIPYTITHISFSSSARIKCFGFQLFINRRKSAQSL